MTENSTFALSEQEIASITEVITLSCQAFKAADYPFYYNHFLHALVSVIESGALSVLQAATEADEAEFSQQALFMSEINKLQRLFEHVGRKEVAATMSGINSEYFIAP